MTTFGLGDGENPPSEKIINSVVNKLTSIIDKHYNCEFDYISQSQLHRNFGQEFLLSLTTQAEPQKQENSFFFPINIKGDFMGAAQVKAPTGIAKDKIEDLQDILTTVLRSTIVAANRLEVLDLLERQIQQPELETNVVQLNNFRKPEGEQMPMKDYDGSQSYFNVPCFIEAENSEDILKMALEVHEKSNRFAFLHFSELDKEIKTDAIKLSKAGHITLFIPELTKLKDDELFALCGYFKNHKTKEGPQIISSSAFGLQKIKESQILPQDFLEIATTAHLRLTRPFSEYMIDGVSFSELDIFH